MTGTMLAYLVSVAVVILVMSTSLKFPKWVYPLANLWVVPFFLVLVAIVFFTITAARMISRREFQWTAEVHPSGS